MSDDLCYYCDGTGERDFLSGARCLHCNGTGWAEDRDYDYDDFEEHIEPIGSCDNCGCDLFVWDESNLCEACEWGTRQ